MVSSVDGTGCCGVAVLFVSVLSPPLNKTNTSTSAISTANPIPPPNMSNFLRESSSFPPPPPAILPANSSDIAMFSASGWLGEFGDGPPLALFGGVGGGGVEESGASEFGVGVPVGGSTVIAGITGASGLRGVQRRWDRRRRRNNRLCLLKRGWNRCWWYA